MHANPRARYHDGDTTAEAAVRPSLPAHRLTYFSDAVVAIAITLLAIPLVDLVPDAMEDGDSAAEVVTHHMASISSFLLSFVVIWRIWTVHHEVFARTEKVSRRIAQINVLWLMCIVVLPFPVEMISTYGDEPFVLALYVAVLFASSVTLAAMALSLHRTGTRQTAPSREVVEQVMGNAACLAVALLLVLAAPGLGFWPLALLLVDGPALALVRRLAPRKPADEA
ncbi:TMEM175 family protein [Streptomyces sp. NPDC057621]|uniref:TMEM175 family protein n=1 Tax=Streptomyces sp. NPDC057621 TaxID=3346186 RepID=UPI0036BEBEB1